MISAASEIAKNASEAAAAANTCDDEANTAHVIVTDSVSEVSNVLVSS